jgi:hypothetical protein
MTEIAVRESYTPAQLATDSGFPDAARSLVLWAESATAAYELSRKLVPTAFCPAQYKGKPEEAAAAMLAGAEVGLSPMASLRAFDVIQGVAAPRAITLRAIVQGQGHEIVLEESTAQRAAGRGRRKGSREWQPYEFTIAQAAALGLTGKDQWKKQPATMLIARFTAGLCRLIAADAILGIPNASEELQDGLESGLSPNDATAAPAPTTKVSRARKPVEPVSVPEPDLSPPDEPGPEPTLDEPADAEELIRPAQNRLLHKLFNDKGKPSRDEALDYLFTLGIEVESTKALTVAQASVAIDALEKLEDYQPEPADA